MMSDGDNNHEKEWGTRQEGLKHDYRVLVEKREKGTILSSDEEERLKNLENQFFELCKEEALEDLKKDYLDQLTDVYVEASGTIRSGGGQYLRRTIEENLIHAMRRATTLFAHLGYDSARMTKRIELLTWVVAGSAIVTLGVAIKIPTWVVAVSGIVILLVAVAIWCLGHAKTRKHGDVASGGRTQG